MAGSEEDETGEVKQSESSWAIMMEHEDLEAAAAACAIAGTGKSARKNTAGVAEAVMAATVAVSHFQCETANTPAGSVKLCFKNNNV